MDRQSAFGLRSLACAPPIRLASLGRASTLSVLRRTASVPGLPAHRTRRDPPPAASLRLRSGYAGGTVSRRVVLSLPKGPACAPPSLRLCFAAYPRSHPEPAEGPRRWTLARSPSACDFASALVREPARASAAAEALARPTLSMRGPRPPGLRTQPATARPAGPGTVKMFYLSQFLIWRHSPGPTAPPPTAPTADPTHSQSRLPGHLAPPR